MPPSRLQPMYPSRRRRSMTGPLLVVVLLLIVGFLIYASTIDTEVPTSRIEQDVTNALPAR
ncbi:MAG: hypothetical protein ACK4SZ_10955 [Allosphingosinicella sp.]|uniref:hypothetical protein n=1 Tax=Allosphingosinicella sp. TaxID=2823234 RepID=UPI0039542410